MRLLQVSAAGGLCVDARASSASQPASQPACLPACLPVGLLLRVPVCPSPRLASCNAVRMGARLEAVVEGLLDPLPEDRMTAEEAAAILAGRPRPARCAKRVHGTPVLCVCKRGERQS